MKVNCVAKMTIFAKNPKLLLLIATILQITQGTERKSKTNIKLTLVELSWDTYWINYPCHQTLSQGSSCQMDLKICAGLCSPHDICDFSKLEDSCVTTPLTIEPDSEHMKYDDMTGMETVSQDFFSQAKIQNSIFKIPDFDADKTRLAVDLFLTFKTGGEPHQTFDEYFPTEHYILDKYHNQLFKLSGSDVTLKARGIQICDVDYYGCYCQNRCVPSIAHTCSEEGMAICKENHYPTNKYMVDNCAKRFATKTMLLCEQKCIPDNDTECNQCGIQQCKLGYWSEVGAIPDGRQCHKVDCDYEVDVIKCLKKGKCMTTKEIDEQTGGYYKCDCTGTGFNGPYCDMPLNRQHETTTPPKISSTTTYQNASALNGTTNAPSKFNSDKGTIVAIIILALFLLVVLALIIYKVVMKKKQSSDVTITPTRFTNDGSQAVVLDNPMYTENE